MYNSKIFSTLFLFTLAVYVSYAQPSGLATEKGKCYAKCYIQSYYGTEEWTFPIYLGDSSIYTEEIEIIVKVQKKEWVQKDRVNKLYANEKKWCIQKTPEEVETFTIVVDTLLEKDFVLITIVEEYLVENGGYTEWCEVVCQTDIYPDFYKEIAEKLEYLEYYDGEIDGKFNPKLKAALLSYQKDNGLPFGSLDVESIKSLRDEF